MAEKETLTSHLLGEVHQKETHRRLDAAVELFSYFQNEENSIHDFEDVGRLVEGLTSWTNSGNPKVLYQLCRALRMPIIWGHDISLSLLNALLDSAVRLIVFFFLHTLVE